MLDKKMKRLGYKHLEADQSVRLRKQDGKRTITSIYTDNTSRMSSSKEEVERAWRQLGEKYKIKDLEDIKFVLGIWITHNR